jgi:MFS transporter
MLPARSEARNVINVATSSGVVKRPVANPPGACPSLVRRWRKTHYRFGGLVAAHLTTGYDVVNQGHRVTTYVGHLNVDDGQVRREWYIGPHRADDLSSRRRRLLIPTLARADGVSLSTGEWILTITLLTGALATPVMGRLADGPRQRAVILVALAAVVAGCVVAAVSSGFIVLIIGRALQGVGLGLLPVAMAIARRNLPPEQARRTIATLSVTTAIGAGLGYPVTGLIAQFLGFRAAYWFGAITVTGARSIGLTVGSALSAAVLMAHTRPGQALPGVGGFEVALVIAAALCLATAVVSFALPGRVPSPRDARTVGEERDLEVVMKNEAEPASSGMVAGEEPAPSRPEEVQPWP